MLMSIEERSCCNGRWEALAKFGGKVLVEVIRPHSLRGARILLHSRSLVGITRLLLGQVWAVRYLYVIF